ncbi:MAG: signal peptidase I [Polyangiaceae bacterium]|nr:signal peptidase I [Polyangiaceae bacterium]
MHKSKLRYVFWPIWLAAVPLGLAALTLWALVPGHESMATGFLGRLRGYAQDQPVPSLIVLFTLYEVLLYRWRHRLPLAEWAGIGGRVDVPTECRADLEHAAQLLDEAQRIASRHAKAIERSLPKATRDEVSEALAALRHALDADPFLPGPFNEALDRASELVAQYFGRWRKSEAREYLESIFIAVAVALLLRAFVIEAFKIPSGSMLPTLQIQDHIFVNKFAYGPQIPFQQTRLWSNLPPRRGDVIVFEYPDPNPQNPRQDFIKRVVALPGDTLEVVGGHPVINGWPVPNCRVGTYDYSEGNGLTKRGELFVEFLGEYSYLTLYEDDRFDGHQGPYQVEQGEIWVLGDNRNNSSDSRAWNEGRGAGAPFENIKGRAMFVWMSFGDSGQITWKRLFTHVMGAPKLPPGAPAELAAGVRNCLSQRPSVTMPPGH